MDVMYIWSNIKHKRKAASKNNTTPDWENFRGIWLKRGIGKGNKGLSIRFSRTLWFIWRCVFDCYIDSFEFQHVWYCAIFWFIRSCGNNKTGTQSFGEFEALFVLRSVLKSRSVGNSGLNWKRTDLETQTIH